MKNLTLLLLIFIISMEITAQNNYPKRELRGAWVATVANIDWPSSRHLSSGEKIAELVAMFDKLQRAGINTIYFQVRTECDALYNSEYEPWSYWLTGEQGKAPEPFFDPLAFAVEEAHRRGMELHAWFNPYRSVKTVGSYTASENHISVTKPEWSLKFDKYEMLDPGNPEVTEYIVKIIEDVITKYDVDGVHFDDYFYPYSPKISNEDASTFEKYKGAFTDVHEWRRFSINNMVENVYHAINRTNSKIKFGISPFGIVENKFAGTNGLESFHVLYCDPITWINNRTVDYVLPQLYWEIGKKVADYAALLPWWASIMNERHFYVGHFSSRFLGRQWSGNKNEMIDQINLNRNYSTVGGSVFFSAKSVTENYAGFSDNLNETLYRYPAFPPLMLWKDSIPPLPPINLTAKRDDKSVNLKWEKPETAEDNEEPFYYVIYRFEDDEEIDLNNVKAIIHQTKNINWRDRNLPVGKITYVISSMDRLHNESLNNLSIVVLPFEE
jgi:uncharacterized lipoprotein YddW (UPF0748 family)